MEIDDLKTTWLKASKLDAPWTAQQLLEASRGKSKSIIGRLKRNLWFEIIMTNGSILMVTNAAFFVKQGPLRWLMVALLIGCMVLGYFLVRKMRLLARFDFGADNLKNNLAELIRRLDTFLHAYRAAYIWSLIGFYMLGVVVVLLESGYDKVLDTLLSGRGLIFAAIYTMVIVGTLLSIDWYIKWLYGKHVNHLRQLLSEISAYEEGHESQLVS